LRITLEYGPISIVTLSPKACTRAGSGLRLGKVIVHPAESAVAVSTAWTGVVSGPPSGVDVTFHFPASEERASGGGGGGGACCTAVLVVSAELPDFWQATTAARQHERRARRRITTSGASVREE
jgi:hypothetical protein